VVRRNGSARGKSAKHRSKRKIYLLERPFPPKLLFNNRENETLEIKTMGELAPAKPGSRSTVKDGLSPQPHIERQKQAKDSSVYFQQKVNKDRFLEQKLKKNTNNRHYTMEVP